LSGIFVYNKLAFDINVRISNLKSLCESGVPFVYFMIFESPHTGILRSVT